MKKDFSQDFEMATFDIYLMVKERKTGKYLVYKSAGEDDYLEMSWLLNFEADQDRQLSIQVAKVLYGRGLSLNTITDIVSHSNVGFSFVDDTPGEEHHGICLLAEVDIVDEQKLNEGPYEVGEFVSLEELDARFLTRNHPPSIMRIALNRLLLEKAIDKG